MFVVSNRICDDLFDRGGPHEGFSDTRGTEMDCSVKLISILKSGGACPTNPFRFRLAPLM